MKKSQLYLCLLAILVIFLIVFLFVFKKINKGNIMDGPGMVNEVSSYSVKVQERGDMVGEDIFVYDDSGKLSLSLQDQNQPQYLFALYDNYIILDSGTSASNREMLVYNIPSGKVIFKTDYYPGENGLVLNDNIITYYKQIPDSLLGDYKLPECETEYDNGYIEKYGYTIGKNMDADLGDLQCAYFE